MANVWAMVKIYIDPIAALAPTFRYLGTKITISSELNAKKFKKISVCSAILENGRH